MRLSEILNILNSDPATKATPTVSLSPETEISFVTSDSKAFSDDRIDPTKTAFVAIRGGKFDGHGFLPEAQRRGAGLLIVESAAGLSSASPVIQVSDTRLASALLASAFQGHPSRAMKMLGVTGTSGKTTTTYLLESILREAGENVGIIGTVEIRYGGRSIEATHTTPDPWALQKTLAEMRDAGVTAVVMEVSSHALKQSRVGGIAFDGMLFTNLSPEHLDYHPDLEDYYQSKKLLFTTYVERALRSGKAPFVAIHDDQGAGTRLWKELRTESPSIRGESFHVESTTSISAQGIRGVFSGIEIESPLLARFNAENIAGAVALTRGMGIPPAQIQSGVKKLAGVPGRLERVIDPKGRVILVDYAHKPDALEKVLKTLRALLDSGPNGAQLFTVFGCGGDRDATKRPVMGKIACELSDQVILTSDNPRTEDPEKILDAIEVGCRGFENYRREPDRAKAIYLAVSFAHAGDIVLIAGKGHEDYQIIGTEKRKFDDRAEAFRALEE